ncbi:MAG: ComEC/Rec2 family competence protein [Bacteroidales bacterium]|nr:ComEC/Rec2 family competence protein [Bacteroidales bacterium]
MFKRPIIIPLIFLIIGIIIVDSFVPVFFVNDHYSAHFDKAISFRYLITDNYKPKKNWTVYEAKVIEYFDGNTWQKTKGKVLINLPKDSEGLNYGDIVESKEKMQRIKNFADLDFDYQKYMNHKRLYHNVYCKDFKVINHNQGNKIIKWAKNANQSLKNRIKSSKISEQNANLAISLLLGDKSKLDLDIKNSFSVTGIAHILCVSGLHIGLILGFIQLITKFICLFGLRFYYLRQILLVIIAWVIALIIGCTPSALRVALMFTIFTLSKNLPIQTNPLNTLYCTAFLLLIADPLLLFDISFQLSFLAVLGILICVPIIDKFLLKYKTKSYFKPIIQNITVSFSAQAFTAPIIIYKFKTFPILFLLTNVIAIPFLGLILISIILLVVFADIGFLNYVLSFVVEIELTCLTSIAKFIEILTKAISI